MECSPPLAPLVAGDCADFTDGDEIVKKRIALAEFGNADACRRMFFCAQFRGGATRHDPNRRKGNQARPQTPGSDGDGGGLQVGHLRAGYPRQREYPYPPPPRTNKTSRTISRVSMIHLARNRVKNGGSSPCDRLVRSPDVAPLWGSISEEEATETPLRADHVSRLHSSGQDPLLLVDLGPLGVWD